MSIETMARVLYHSRAQGTTKLILLGIANHDGDGGAWPTLATLATYGSCSVRQAQRALDELEQLGEIKRDLKAGGLHRGDDRYRPNLYHVLVDCPPGCDGSNNHRPVDNWPFRGDTPVTPDGLAVTSTASRGDIHGASEVTRMSPKP